MLRSTMEATSNQSRRVPRVFLLDCFSKHGHRTIRRRIIIAWPRACEVGNLNVDVGDNGEQLVDKGLSLGRTVRALLGNAGSHVHHDGHAMLVGCAKDAAELLDVGGIIDLYVRIPEVKLDTTTQVRILCATLQLLKRV